jgi:hypothetical protein
MLTSLAGADEYLGLLTRVAYVGGSAKGQSKPLQHFAEVTGKSASRSRITCGTPPVEGSWTGPWVGLAVALPRKLPS